MEFPSVMLLFINHPELLQHIFAAHYEMADDPMLEEQTMMMIEEGVSAYDAVLQTSEALCTMFDKIDDEYLKARKDDVKDVCRRIARKISGDEGCAFADVPEGSIIVAHELVPSDTAQMDFSRICGFITPSAWDIFAKNKTEVIKG